MWVPWPHLLTIDPNFHQQDIRLGRAEPSPSDTCKMPIAKPTFSGNLGGEKVLVNGGKFCRVNPTQFFHGDRLNRHFCKIPELNQSD